MRRKDTTNEFLKECMADALIQLLNHKRLNDISITELTNAANVGRVTFYRNFNSKEELLTYKIEILFEDLLFVEGYGENPAIFSRMLLMYFQMVLDYGNILVCLYKADALYPLRDFLYRHMCNEQEDSTEMKLLKAFYAYGIYGITVEWIKNGFHWTPERMLDFTINNLNKLKDTGR